MKNVVENIIHKIKKDFFDSGIIKNKDILIIGLSGGMDSMCLLDVFFKLIKDYDIKLIAFHINHGIRGDEAGKDQNFVEKYCKNFSIQFEKVKVDAISYSKEHNISIEESARILRYKEFEKLWKKETLLNIEQNVYVLVAHHMLDQVETIIHNMARGTGLKGLSGMKKVGEYILRPFLDIAKDDIEEYVNYLHIPYVNDSTNNDTNYTRNYIRKVLIGDLIKVNTEAVKHISDLSYTIKEIDEYLELLSKHVLEKMMRKDFELDRKNKKCICIDVKLFNNTSHIIKIEIVKEVIKRLVLTLKDLTRKNIEDVILLSSKEKGGHLDLPYNITVDKKKSNLLFILNNENLSMKKKVNKGKKI